jgi:DNA-directed RNA polymerase subunit RPC12/RpoP
VGSIDSRLRRLEEEGRRGACPECKLPPDAPGSIVLIDEEHPEESFEGDPDERCQRCGRRLWLVIEVVYR